MSSLCKTKVFQYAKSTNVTKIGAICEFIQYVLNTLKKAFSVTNIRGQSGHNSV